MASATFFRSRQVAEVKPLLEESDTVLINTEINQRKFTNDIYVLLPYLTTSAPVSIRGVTFRSSSDLEGVPTAHAEHLGRLFSMFYLRPGYRIKEMVYAYYPATESEKYEQLVSQVWRGHQLPGEYNSLANRLWEAFTLVTYLNSAPDDDTGAPVLPSERSSLYMFQPFPHIPASVVWPRINVEYMGHEPEPIDEPASEPGYDAVCDFRIPVWVGYESKLYPPSPQFFLKPELDLHAVVADFDAEPADWAISGLLHGALDFDEKLQERVFTALEWYNWSCTEHVDERIALLTLSTAFESLFGLEQGQDVKKRLRETLVNMLGPGTRLDSWFEQFYDARSNVTHDGRAGRVWFVGVNRDRISSISKTNTDAWVLRPLTGYGRRIFRLCLRTMLANTASVRSDPVFNWFTRTEEKLLETEKILQDGALSPEDRLQLAKSVLLPLNREYYETEGPVNVRILIKTGQSLLKAYLSTSPPMPQVIQSQMQIFVSFDSKTDERGAAVALMQLRAALPSEPADNEYGPENLIWEYVDFTASVPFHLQSLLW
jgi:Apea-like HEPN